MLTKSRFNKEEKFIETIGEENRASEENILLPKFIEQKYLNITFPPRNNRF